MLANLVAYVVDKYGPINGKKAFQKIFYFLTQMGIPTNLKYFLYHYGPYSSELDVESSTFENMGVINIERSGYGYKIFESDLTKKFSNSSEIIKFQNEVDKILSKIPISNPLKLELYSTTHYATKVIKDIYESDNINDVIQEVKNIKGKKFSEEEIRNAYNYLKEKGFFITNQGSLNR